MNFLLAASDHPTFGELLREEVQTTMHNYGPWISALAVVALYLTIFIPKDWKKYLPIKKDPNVVPPNPAPLVPGVTPPTVVTVDPTKIKTAQDVKNLYDEFRKAKKLLIAELEARLVKERQELADLDMVPVNTVSVVVPGEVTP